MKNPRIKNLFSLFLLLGLSFLVLLFSIYISKINAEISSLYLGAIVSQSLIQKRQPSSGAITLIFVGDIMLDRGIEYMVKNHGDGNYEFPFLKIADFLKKADILFGNLEGPISNKGKKVGSIYSFRADPKAVEGLTYAGFDILSVANNHIFDYGKVAMEDTFLNLKKAGIEYVGGGFTETEAHSPIIKEVDKTKIAFLAYTNLGSKYWEAKGNNSGIAWLNKEKMEKDIKIAKNQADIVVVSIHTGREYQAKPNLIQKYSSHLFIDAGADLVIGHHPHVIQEIEKYKNNYIAYSLGNFVFDQGFSKETMKGLLLRVIIKDNKIKTVDPIEIKINKFFQPEIIEELEE
ncbi:CapA family protein [Patescibacteria group bacterium]|nr:CapA family protein [Patescibacteria group bacterium]